MTRAEFIQRSINSTNNSISGARAQLVVDANKPRVSRNLTHFIEECEIKLLRYNMGILNEDEEFHLDNIDS